MNVEERKHQARLFEQQGEFEDALGLYEEILAELEGTPEIWRELPLYVKAGDLSLKMGDASAAISHYDKAARAYAAYGSAKSVIALCTKILRVNSGHTHAFLRLVRLMIERDHLAEARLVLLEYSERMKLPKAGVVLEDLADRPDEELKPLLELLLELGGRYEYARAQGRDQAADADSDEQEPETEEEATVEESAETSGVSIEKAEDLQPGEPIQQGFSTEDEDADVAETSVDPDPEQSSEPEEDAETGGEPEQAAAEPATPTKTVPSEDEVHWVEDRPSMQMSAPRASRQVLFREGESRKSKPKALWIILGAVAVVVVGGLSLVLFDVIPLGGDAGAGEALPEAAPVTTDSDSALMAGVDLDDSTSAEDESVATTPSETAESQIDAEVVTSQDSTSVGADDLAAEGEVALDDTLPTNEELVLDEPPAVPALPASRGVMVQDFDIESATDITADGRVGYRITQILGTGEQLTLEAVYFGEDIAAAPGTEEMTLAPLAGDTTTAIIQFNGYAVEARAIVSASVLEALLARLTEVPPSN